MTDLGIKWTKRMVEKRPSRHLFNYDHTTNNIIGPREDVYRCDFCKTTRRTGRLQLTELRHLSVTDATCTKSTIRMRWGEHLQDDVNCLQDPTKMPRTKE